MSLEYTVNKLFQVCVLMLFFFVQVSLGQGSGTVRGTVSDKNTGETLPGANVVVQGTSFGAAANLDGEFIIRGVPAGQHTIVVTYIGYEPASFDMNVEANRTIETDFELSPTAVEGETVIVTAQAQGQLEAINQQLTSDKIANIVSEARIQELPDFNAASSLSRLPGISTTQSSGEDNKVVIRGLSPKYNSIEVEGVKLSATGSADIGLTSDEFVYVKGENEINNDRSVDLTMISPYMIRMISVYKSLTPDMNANSIGGTVNMELREAPSGLHTDILWQSGYTAKSKQFGNYRAVASGSNRFFDEQLGVYALFNIESYDRNADNLDAYWDEAEEGSGADPVTGYRPVKVTSVRFNRHVETRERFGGNLILDYNIPNGSIKLVNLLARINSDYTDYRQIINYNNGRLEWRLQEGENVTDQQMHSLKLDYDLGFLTADLSASYTSANNKLENSPVLIFNQVGGVLIQDRDNVVPEQLSYLVNFNGVDNVVLRSGNLFSNDYKEDKYTYKADFQVPFNFGIDVTGFLQFGGQYNNQSNSTDQETPYLSFDGSALPTSSDNISNNMMRALQSQYGLTYNSAGQFTGPSFLNSDSEIFDSFLEDTYGDIYYASNPGFLSEMLKGISRNPAFDATDPSLSNGRQGGWYNGPYQQLANDYNFDENYYAAYAMSRINFLDFMVIGGVRYEKVKSDYFAYNAIDQRNAQIQRMYDTTSVNENEFVLPMVQVKYSPFDWVDVRYAYTQTLSRPDYQALSPKFTITQATDIYAGNPELTPAKSFNHDVNITFHNNEIGLLTVGGFYKTIEDFVYQAEYRLDAAQNAGIDNASRYTVIRDGLVVVSPVQLTGTVFRPLNNIFDATVKGLEFDFQHSFWYLPSPFNNLVFGINYARIYSETRYPYYSIEVIPGTRPPQFTLIDSSFSGRLIDQPNHVLNSYLGYDYEGFSARLSIVFQDNAARDNGGELQENDSFTKEYTRLDFSARQKLPWFNSEVFLDVTNLNDERTSWVQRSVGGYMGIQNYGLTANLGIRVRY
jgi:TonB-dependent receptor